MREAQGPTSWLFTAKQAICVFLIGSGSYTIYCSRYERQAGLKVMTIFMGAAAIGYGAYHLSQDKRELEQEENAN